mmetsp:Transcript_23353/g.61100  ORF Transcript_23353/g.61100 Transcript_23353/m.61100 type:complete len:240 (+) Transcript_23353:176-895(+)
MRDKRTRREILEFDVKSTYGARCGTQLFEKLVCSRRHKWLQEMGHDVKCFSQRSHNSLTPKRVFGYIHVKVLVHIPRLLLSDVLIEASRTIDGDVGGILDPIHLEETLNFCYRGRYIKWFIRTISIWYLAITVLFHQIRGAVCEVSKDVGELLVIHAFQVEFGEPQVGTKGSATHAEQADKVCRVPCNSPTGTLRLSLSRFLVDWLGEYIEGVNNIPVALAHLFPKLVHYKAMSKYSFG